MSSKKILGPRINSGDIVPEVREMAVAWNGHRANDEFFDTTKLASDVQYTCIDLMKQFCEKNNIDPSLVELFFKEKDKE